MAEPLPMIPQAKAASACCSIQAIAQAKAKIGEFIERLGLFGIDLGPLAIGARLVQFPGGPLPTLNLVKFGLTAAYGARRFLSLDNFIKPATSMTVMPFDIAASHAGHLLPAAGNRLHRQLSQTALDRREIVMPQTTASDCELVWLFLSKQRRSSGRLKIRSCPFHAPRIDG
jgi:hypothetical protein